jgi:hypothetical protein
MAWSLGTRWLQPSHCLCVMSACGSYLDISPCSLAWAAKEFWHGTRSLQGGKQVATDIPIPDENTILAELRACAKVAASMGGSVLGKMGERPRPLPPAEKKPKRVKPEGKPKKSAVGSSASCCLFARLCARCESGQGGGGALFRVCYG